MIYYKEKNNKIYKYEVEVNIKKLKNIRNEIYKNCTFKYLSGKEDLTKLHKLINKFINSNDLKIIDYISDYEEDISLLNKTKYKKMKLKQDLVELILKDEGSYSLKNEYLVRIEEINNLIELNKDLKNESHYIDEVRRCFYYNLISITDKKEYDSLSKILKKNIKGYTRGKIYNE